MLCRGEQAPLNAKSTVYIAEALQGAVFGRCIAADFNGVYKDKCLTEFLKLKDCYTVYYIFLPSRPTLTRLRLLQNQNELHTGPRFEGIAYILKEEFPDTCCLRGPIPALHRTSFPIGCDHNDVRAQYCLNWWGTFQQDDSNTGTLPRTRSKTIIPDFPVRKSRHYASWRRIRRRAHRGL